jgi:hypothetical protein
VKDDRYGYGFWPYIVPYAAFVLLSQLSDRFPDDWWLLLLAVKPALPLALIAFFYSRGMYPELHGFGAHARGVPLDVLVGLGSAAVWMAPYLLAPPAMGELLRGVDVPVLGTPWPDTSAGFDPARAGAAFAPLALGLRAFGYVIVTPLFEELFIRSFVMRFAAVYDSGRDFRDVAIAHYTARSFWVTTVFFTLGHLFWEYWGAVPWVIGTTLWFYRRGHLGAVIVVHATANAAVLAAAVWADGPLWYFV